MKERDQTMLHESEDSRGQQKFYNGRRSIRVSDDIEADESTQFQIENENWSWRYMKKQLRDRNLESLYSRYHQILHKRYFSVFLILQLILTAIHIGLLLVKEVNDPQHKTLPDIILYISFTLLLWMLVSVVYNKSLVKKFPSLPHVVSCFAIAIVVVVDIALPIYHTAFYHSRITLRPAYATHALLACYIFLPLHNNITPVILGLGITTCHLFTLIAVTYRNSNYGHNQIISEFIFFMCLNFLGMYYRFINEMIVIITFLDRRACVEFTMKLNYEKEQEEQLLLSILPWHIAARVREDIRRKDQPNMTDEMLTSKPFKELYIEKHDNVSILFADVVNYTKMTSSLPVNKLVETLNELFGRFDEASERRKVLRIKFLGDCYCCASGIPQPNPQHAKSCVDLGLDMISIIKEVRQDRKLDIDMRIGVHSGSLLSGLLGRCKWQYDIWSKDVVIANHMEQAGKPGMVHITQQTLQELGNEYKVEPGNGDVRDELLAKYNIITYLIRPQEKELRGVTSGDGHTAISRRRTAFMDKNLIMYQQRLKMADVYMEKAIENLPLGKYNWSYKSTQIHPLFLTFHKGEGWELPFIEQPDPLFKFYVLSALFVSLCISTMQLLGVNRLHWISWVDIAVSTTVLILLVPLTWSHYIWNALKDPKRKLQQVPEPENKILFLLHRTSTKIICSWYLRTFLYILICFFMTICAFADVINHMNGSSSCNDIYSNRNIVDGIESQTYCHSPWQITESCSLVILTSFLFIRMYFLLKLVVGSCILAIYSWLIMGLKLDFDGQETWNPNLDPKIAHILSLCFIVIGLHLMDRQAEFMNRLDYRWKKQLVKEKEEVEKTRSVNLMLLHNILPIHVAKVYLNTDRTSHDLYHENYDCVSVMFASLTNYYLYDDKDMEHSEIRSLEILNQIICDFDDALLEPKFKTIEKIKVAGSTYMAACGLHPGQKDSNNLNGPSSTKILLSLVEFATNVMRRLQKINRKFNTNFMLRVGISQGPVTAGVVGSQKPLYDIWGNAVNIAARMDTTGEPGKIQVTASTASILEEEGIRCVLRGPTFVKGKGIMETYFIKLTDDFRLQKKILPGV